MFFCFFLRTESNESMTILLI